MRFIRRLTPIVDLFNQRPRGAYLQHGRVHIDLPPMEVGEHGPLVRALRDRLQHQPGVRWFEINPPLRRIVIALDDSSPVPTPAECLRWVEEAEANCVREPVSGDWQDLMEGLPDDERLERQRLLEMAADLLSVWFAAVLRVVPFVPTTLGGHLVVLLSLVDAVPRLRDGLESRLGKAQADLVLNLAMSFAQALAERPLSALVDLSHKAALYREIKARRELWAQRARTLFKTPLPTTPDAPASARPVPLPHGPIENYTDRTWLLAAGGFGLSLLTSRSIRSATGAVFSALPRPARLGRELYAAELSRILSRRGTLVMSPDALRRLDRIDCLVLQGDLISHSQFRLGELRASHGHSESELRDRVRALFDAERPCEVSTDGRWRLGPASLLGVSLDEASATVGSAEAAHATTDMAALSLRFAQRGALALALCHGDHIVALQEVTIQAQTGAEELVRAAEEFGMRVVLASDDENAIEGVGVHDIVPGGAGLAPAIRQLQREGQVVAYVGKGNSAALAAADCGIGLCRAGEPPPWGAHLICGDDISELRTVLQACITARTVSRQSVRIALGAAAVGTLVSGRSILKKPTRRVLFVVNAASLLSMLNGFRRSSTLVNFKPPPAKDPTPWHALDAEAVLVRLHTNTAGLTTRDAETRAELRPPPPAAWRELASAVGDELFNPLAPLLAAGAGLSALVGSTADAGMVAGVGGINALVGGVQRFRTERAIRELIRPSEHSVQTRRGGQRVRLGVDALVRGDVLELGAGDFVPADCRVLEADSLEIDASSLTGESLPVSKSAAPSFEAAVVDRSCMLYAGTTVAAGRCTAVVVATGPDTESQRGSMRRDARPRQGGVEERLRSLMMLTGPVAALGGIGLMGAGLLRGRRLEDLVSSGVSLAVAAVPEGLPLLATAAQLAAAERLSRRGILVRNPRCIEALGRVDVICLDKTGTLTEGRIQLHAVHDGVDETPMEKPLPAQHRGVLAAALLAVERCDPGEVPTDPTDEALRRGAMTLDIPPAHEGARVRELAFAARRGFHAVLRQDASDVLLSVKGAPELVLANCTHWGSDTRPMLPHDREHLMAEAARMADSGLRVLAVAERRDPTLATDAGTANHALQALTFRGLLAFRDTLRDTAQAAIAGLRTAGIRVVLLTGDHPSTARAIANELGLLGRTSVVTGTELMAMSDEALMLRLSTAAVFARVTPAQKVRVVRTLRRMGHTVAMAGDGTNDAPAMRVADVGLAVGERSTPAAKASADVVLADNRIDAIVDTLVEGRAMWVSVRDAVAILLGGNLGEIGFTVGAGLLLGRPPLSPRQLLLVNFLTDIAPAMAIALRPPPPTTLAALAFEGPDVSLGSPLNRDIASRALITAAGAGSAWLMGRLTGSAARANTIGLAALVGTQLGQTLVSGGTSRPVLWTSVGSAAALAGIIQVPGLSHLFGCRPLGPVGWATAIGASATATAASHFVPRSIDWATQHAKQRWVDLTHVGPLSKQPRVSAVDMRSLISVTDEPGES